MVTTLDHDYTGEHSFFYSHALDLQSLPIFLKKKKIVFKSPKLYST